jgi:hypothetical protein
MPAMAAGRQQATEPPTITPAIPNQPMNHGRRSLHIHRAWGDTRLGLVPHRSPAKHQSQNDQHSPNERHTELHREAEKGAG